MICNDVNMRDLRIKNRIKLSELADLSGYSAAKISQMETGGAIDPNMKDAIVSILLQCAEEGINIEVKIWRDRALRAEERLVMVKAAMSGWVEDV